MRTLNGLRTGPNHDWDRALFEVFVPDSVQDEDLAAIQHRRFQEGLVLHLFRNFLGGFGHHRDHHSFQNGFPHNISPK